MDRENKHKDDDDEWTLLPPPMMPEDPTNPLPMFQPRKQLWPLMETEKAIASVLRSRPEILSKKFKCSLPAEEKTSSQ